MPGFEIRRVTAAPCAVALIAVAVFLAASPASAQGVLDVELINGYNLVVDSNITAPSTYGPSAAYIGAKICNTGNASLSNVFAYTGNYNAGVGSTPGIFPVHDSTGDLVHPQLTNTGNYSLTLESGDLGAVDASRYIGTLAAGQCRVQYWLISYPQCVNVGGQSDTPPCEASIAGGVDPSDDLSLNYDIWATTSTAIATPTVSERSDLTMRNEISAAANKIWPNTDSKVPDAYLTAIQSVIGWGTLGPDGQPLTASNPVYPGQRVITTQGIWYDLGNVGQGFDNDGDLVPDQNAWLQPVGDAASFAPDCFRMVNNYGLLIVKLKSGGEQLIPFQNQLYFEHIPENTGVVGLVYYQFIATDQGCSAAMTPYQEAASGFDNEKFSSDFGLSNPLLSGSFGPNVSFTKSDGLSQTTVGSTLTYTLSATNTSAVPLGAPDLGVPLTFRETIPAGVTYVTGSADDSPASNLTEPAGTGSFTQSSTDINGEYDTCTIGYNVTSSQWIPLYSTNNGATWSSTEPGSGVTDIQWMLFTTMALDGYHNGTDCVVADGLFDNGTLETSIPPGQSVATRFQVTVATTAGPVVCNTADLGFGPSEATTAQDCTIITGNNSLTGNVFKDDGTGAGTFGNGSKDGTEAGIGAGVVVTLYYDFDGDGELSSADLLYGSTTTNASGVFTFGSLPDGPYLVVVQKYDGATSNGINDAATDAAFGTTGWGNTTVDPNLPLTTDQGVLTLSETLTTATLAVNIDLDRSTGTGQNVTNVNFGFAPPLELTKSIGGHPDSNSDGKADTGLDEGDVFTYNLSLTNRLPSVGIQGPTGCQYTFWATTGTNGSPAQKEFVNPTAAWDGPNRNVSSALVQGGGLKYIQGTGFVVPTQPGNVTKVEALFMGYFSTFLTDDNLTLKVDRPPSGSNQTTFSTTLIDSYVGEPADLSPDSAISWDVTSLRPGGGSWSWVDNFANVTLEINPSKASAADEKTFYLDAMGLRITTDQACEAGTSTTLSPVPLQDSYDTGSFSFISASPTPDSVNTATGVIQWNDVGPIVPGDTQTVSVIMQALNVTGSRSNTSSPLCTSTPVNNSTCNWAQTNWGGRNVYYADGRLANDDDSSIAVDIQGKGEIRGTVWKDSNVDGWPNNDGEPGLPSVDVTLWGCVRADGVTMETTSANKVCTAVTNGNFWKSMGTYVTTSTGSYEFIGLDTGFYVVEIGDNNDSPIGGNTSPYSGTQTAEPDDTQGTSAGSATGTNGVCAGGCNNTWGNPSANTNTLNLLNSPSAEEIINGVNFGYDTGAVLYGNVWWDVDGDATRDPVDSDQAGFTVRLYTDPNGDGNTADGTVLFTTTTDANGNYMFTGVSIAAGSYVIAVTAPTLLHKVWVETVESTGGTGSLNSQIPVTILAGAVSGSHDFGYTQTDASDIGDYVFFDFDADGIKDPSEEGIPSITVWLYEDVDRDGSIDSSIDTVVSTTSTDSAGYYLFQNFPAGSYIVKVDTSDPDFPTNVTPTGDPDLSDASIGDTIFFDANGNGTQDAGDDGIPLVIVNLYTDDDASGTLNGADSLVASTMTNVNGNYLFTGLSAGTYFVDVDESTLPSTALALTTADPAATAVVFTSNTVATTNLTKDAGYGPAANFAIGNRIWHDVDNDGVQDAGEVGIPNIDIVITNGTGTGCPSGCRVTTDEAGYWIVTGLTAGTFSVNVDNADPDFPRDFTLSTGSTDPRTATVTTADLNNIDFGYHYTGSGSSPTGTVSGRVFLDADGDLAYDAGEERAGKTVNLLDQNGFIIASTTTSGTGTYSFSGAFVGDYTVQAVDQLGTRYSTLFLNAAQNISNLNVIFQSSNETTADSQSSVSVDGVHADLLQDFGYQRFLGSIGDSIFWDVNENGTQDIGEPGFDAVTVRLYDAIWTDANGDGFYQSGEATTTLVATTATVADDPLTSAYEGGTYLFTNLDELASGHNYLVVVDTTTIAGTETLISDPDTDGTPCTVLPSPDVIGDAYPPPSVCDNHKLVLGLAPGNNYLGADFGYRITGTGFATIGDQLWIDSDGDGVRDSGEAGIPQITVWLDDDNDGTLDWTDGNANGVWDSGEGERWVETDSEGYYVFTSIANGTYNLKVLTSDTNWPSGLSTTPTFEVRGSNTASRNNAVQVVVTSGAVSSIVDGDPANDPDTCSSCNLNVDFGYRYAGTNSLSGTVCKDDASKNGYCGATATTYSGVDTTESPLEGIQIGAYRWTDDGDGTAWNAATGTLDSGDTFLLLGTASTDALGNYSFSNLPDNVILVFGVSESQELDLTTTNATSSVEDANVLKRQLYEGTNTYLGNTVTVLVRQALSLAGDTDDNIQDADFAFDPTLNGTLVYDYGDLPASYSSTLLAEGGAQHRVTGSSIFLGSGVTTETDGVESATAAGDSNDTGIVMISSADEGGSWVEVTASAAGWVAGWIDFNADGDFDDADEMILDHAVQSGVNSLSFYVPNTLPAGVTDFFGRFRIYPSRPQIVASEGPGLDSSFQKMSGEVEDYMLTFSFVPTFVEMLSMKATAAENRVELAWHTSREVDNLGFHVYRQRSGGERERVNQHLIPGSAFLAKRAMNRPHSYRFTDNSPADGFVQYWIEDVDLDGTRTMHGPVTPDRELSAAFSAASVSGPAVTSTTEADPTIPMEGGVFTTPAGMGVKIAPPPTPTTTQLGEQWKLAGVPAAKVVVTRPGWYRVTRGELMAAGFDPGSNPRVISVFTNGLEVPAVVTSRSPVYFDSTDTIEFFGRGLDTPGTGGRVYYITSKKGTGLRMKSTGAKSGRYSVPSFTYSFERTERTIFFGALTNTGERENFFGEIVSTYPITQALTVTNRDTAANSARLEVVLQGATEDIEHVVLATLNGHDLGLIRFDGQERHSETLTVSASYLLDGQNTLTLTAQNGDLDVSLVESVKLSYAHRFRAEDDALAFTVKGNAGVKVSGFTSDRVRVIDVTDPKAPFFINVPTKPAGDGTYGLSFTAGGTGIRTLFAFGPGRVLAPARIATDATSALNSFRNAAKLVILTNSAFTTAASSLKAARQAEGLSATVVNVQDVYDEFSYGHHSPQAVRDFLARSTKWKTVPRYVVLLGDASFDPRNYYGTGSFDFVPTKLVATSMIKSASDDWFADFSGTALPSMAIGRLPARTAEEADAMVAKLTTRSVPSSGWGRDVDVVADWDNEFPFSAAADNIAAEVPSSYEVGRITIGETPAADAAILDAFNSGSLLLDYVGHGSVEVWSDNVFTSDAAATLTNAGKLPFVSVMNCLNGYFQDVFTESLGEALLKNPNGGAIAVWASSALTTPGVQLSMNLEFNRRVLGSQSVRIGDAILQAKAATTSKDVRRSWILLGDPSMKLK